MGRPLSERRRVREVRKYYRRQPDDVPIAGSNIAPSTIAATRIVSPNTTLTALMQLIAWRLGKQRAMVSVVDQSAQARDLGFDDDSFPTDSGCLSISLQKQPRPLTLKTMTTMKMAMLCGWDAEGMFIL